jgi:hypothetical protein
MPIEFRCGQCGKLLRTGDDTIGRQAQCPECGAISTVPTASEPSQSPAPPLTPLGGASPFGGTQAPGEEGSDNPYQSPASATYLPPGQTDAAQRVAGPAIALMVTAILGIIAQSLGIIMAVAQVGVAHGIRQPRGDAFPMMFQGGMNVGLAVVELAVGAVILIGAMKMKKLESYGFALTAAIVAMIPCISPCCLLGLPFGIWALVVLNDASVKAAFRS